jgi:leader peptidase (prepilin peptidase)/N-methyltransferase
MGGGDIKLLAMIGAFLGWQAVLVTLMIGSLTGSVIGLVLLLAQRGDRRTAIPFGPFLAVGAAAALFWGDALIRWYLGLSHMDV